MERFGGAGQKASSRMADSVTCPWCGREIRVEAAVRGDGEYTAVPRLTLDTKDPCAKYYDGWVHTRCLGASTPAMADLRSELLRYFQPPTLADKTCEVCGEVVRDPDDFVGWSVLTRDPTESLFAYNNLRFHRHHVRLWPDLGAAVEAVRAATESGRYHEYGITWLLRQVEQTKPVDGAAPDD